MTLLLLFESVIPRRVSHQIVFFSDECIKFLLVGHHLDLIEPAAHLKVSEFVDVDAHKHRKEPEEPHCQEVQVVGKDYQKQYEHRVVIFLHFILYKEHPAKQSRDLQLL